MERFMITRIRWNQEENVLVAKKWIEICTYQFQNPLSPGSLVETAMAAQNVLPETRRRPRSSLQGKQGMSTLFRTIEQIINEPKVKQEQAIPIKEDKVETIDSIIRDLNLDSVAGELGKRIGAVIVREAMAALTTEFNTRLPELQKKATMISRKLPKVLVIGPLNGQQEILEKAVDGMLDLRFVSSAEGAQLIDLRGKHCDACFLWTDYMNHSHQSVAKRTFTSEQITFINGGVDKLKNHLEEFAISVM
jgi:hypothetical protein